MSAPLQAPALDTLRVRIDGTRLYDALGRELLLRGINAGGRSKLPPFAPFPFKESGRADQADAPAFELAAAQYFDRLRDWGLSLVRLPFSWEALEPKRGQYDAAYLERYLAMARACGERGMRVLVDFHQDVFARPYAGDGFPLWACPESGLEPSAPVPHWFMGYMQDERVRLAFDRFWRNDDGLRDAFEGMWRKMAAAAWTIDAVIGFEPINEPGWGSAPMQSWAADTLTPFYAQMARVIREAAPGAPIFIDATGGDALSGTTGLGKPAADGLVFAPHFYAPEVILEGRWHGSAQSFQPLRAWSELGSSWQLPVLLGEFGITPRAQGAAAYVRANYDMLDELLMHGTLWECSTTVDDWNDEAMSVLGPGGRELDTLAELVRAYPIAVAGELRSYRFDAAASSGEIAVGALAGGVTEVAVPAQRYPNGVACELNGVAGRVEHETASGRLLLRCDEAGEARLGFRPR